METMIPPSEYNAGDDRRPIILLIIISIFIAGYFIGYIFVSRCRRYSSTNSNNTQQQPQQEQQHQSQRRTSEESMIPIDDKIPVQTFSRKPSTGPSDDKKDDDRNCCEECVVCLSDLEEGEEIRILPRCGHVYHKDCIDEWFKKGSSYCCPICRDSVLRSTKENMGDVVIDVAD